LLEGKLKPEELKQVYHSYDIVGDIAVIRVPEKLAHQSQVIAEAIMQLHGNVKAVWRQAGAVEGVFRLRKLVHVAGEKRTETTHREFGCIFKVDLEKCYFSPRLSFERMRIASLVKPREIVVNMFAGVGSYSILIAKHTQAKKIYSIDVNPTAFQYMQENILLNKVFSRIIALKGDAKVFIKEKLHGKADRILMPLPEKAYDYLEAAVETLKPKGGWVHYYDFEHANSDDISIDKAKMKVSEKLSQMNLNFMISSSRVVRDTGPRWRQIVLDIHIEKYNQ
jgi:tRNA (guanine37-N1)-methyltransferase